MVCLWGLLLTMRMWRCGNSEPAGGLRARTVDCDCRNYHQEAQKHVILYLGMYIVVHLSRTQSRVVPYQRPGGALKSVLGTA
jgi:hypothetical protein